MSEVALPEWVVGWKRLLSLCYWNEWVGRVDRGDRLVIQRQVLRPEDWVIRLCLQFDGSRFEDKIAMTPFLHRM